MGRDWRDEPEWRVVADAESLLARPLAPLLLDPDPAALAGTANAQLAVLLVGLMAWARVRERITPIAFAGHSLGQVTALVASEALSFDDGVVFAATRAEATQACADANPGGLAALLGSDRTHLAAATAVEDCWLANDNAPGQIVIGGTPDGLDAGTEAARAAGARRAQRLAVGGAFHTPLMDPAAAALASALEGVEFGRPTAPVVANDDAAVVDEPAQWRSRSARHVACPVRWRESQLALVGLGATHVVEVGHGSMLTALAKRTIPDTARLTVGAPADVTELP